MSGFQDRLSTLDISHLDEETRRAMYLKTVEPLWRRGNLRFLLDETQLIILDRLQQALGEKFFFLCSRRLGKSYTLVTLAFSLCITKKNARVLYLFPFAKDGAEIVGDIAVGILDSCPKDLKPEYNAQAKEFRFSNGSIIRFKGVNGEHAQYLRGGACDLIILDECGTMDDLEHVVQDICMPMILTTNGRLLLATTPSAKEPNHFSASLYERLAGQNATIKFTVLDNQRVSKEKKARYFVDAGEDPATVMEVVEGLRPPRTTTIRREYFCEFVTEASSLVLPEFPRKGQPGREEIIKESSRPEFFDAYASMDPGMVDRTGILYSHWDFKRGKLVIEDESLLQSPSTVTIAAEIRQKEWNLWRGKEPALRISDVEKRLILDLNQQHGLRFIQAQKQNSDGAISLVRDMIQTRVLEINPRCVHLIRQCENAIWNNKATDFAREGDKKADGHFDLLAALKYLCRHVNQRKNPNPYNRSSNTDPNTFRSPRQELRRAQNRGTGLFQNNAFTRKALSGRVHTDIKQSWPKGS